MALVVARKMNQKTVLILDGRIIAEIAIGQIHGETVRLVIDAPPEVEIWREELFRRSGEHD